MFCHFELDSKRGRVDEEGEEEETTPRDQRIKSFMTQLNSQVCKGSGTTKKQVLNSQG